MRFHPNGCGGDRTAFCVSRPIPEVFRPAGTFGSVTHGIQGPSQNLPRVIPNGLGESTAIQKTARSRLIVGWAEFGGKGPSIGCGCCFGSENSVSSIRWPGMDDGRNDRREGSRMASSGIG